MFSIVSGLIMFICHGARIGYFLAHRIIVHALGFYYNKCLLKQIGEPNAINNILGCQL